MNILKKISPEWSLRLGLGLMYLYSGQDLINHPTAWTWVLPYWFKQIVAQFISVNTFLKIHGSIEIIFALVLLAWFVTPHVVKWVALLSTLEFLGILIFAFTPWSEANFLITFRDIGLLGAAAALYFLLSQQEEKAARIG